MKIPIVAPLDDDVCIAQIPKAWYAAVWVALSQTVITPEFWDGSESEIQQAIEWGNDLLAMLVECDDGQ